MHYHRSNSLMIFYKRQKEIFDLLKIGRKVLPLAERSFKTIPKINPLVRSGIVLLYSHIEGYIEDVIHESINYLNNSGIDETRIPLNIKIANCGRDLDDFIANQAVEKKGDILEKLIKNNYPLWTGGTFPPNKIDTACLTRKFANPSSEHIDSLFKYFGIVKPFRSFHELGFSSKSVGQILSSLDSLAQLRHNIAHGDFSTTCTDKDLANYIKVMNLFCRCVDARLGLEVQRITGLFPWPK